jgi:hypothetical protein
VDSRDVHRSLRSCAPKSQKKLLDERPACPTPFHAHGSHPSAAQHKHSKRPSHADPAVDNKTVERAKQIVLKYRRLSARHAVHLSSMEKHGIERILSFDSGFDSFPVLHGYRRRLLSARNPSVTFNA